jgi:putative oxidoreductase
MATTEASTPHSMSLADAGLLILRVGVGATMLQAGLRKAFDFSTTVDFMESGGWRLPKFAAFMVTAAETAGGIGLLLGLLTPLALCAVIAAMIDAWAVNVSAAAFWSDPFNVPFLIAVGPLRCCSPARAATPSTARSSETGALASASLWDCWSWPSPRHC